KIVLSSTPGFLKKYGLWIGIAGLVVIVWAEHSTHMFSHARATGWLLLAILAGAVVSGFLFGKRIWCQYICPLGKLIGQYATISSVVLRSNSNVCLSQCQTHDCIKDAGCPMDLHPSASKTTNECILCLSCARNCPHKAVRLDARFPWQGLFTQRNWEFSRAFFAILLVALILAVKLPAWIATNDFLPHRVRNLSLFDIPGSNLLIFAAIIIGYFVLVSVVSLLSNAKDFKKSFVYTGYAYLPLAFVGWFNIYFREFVDHGHEILPLAASIVGLSEYIRMSWVTPNLATLKGLIPIITLVGATISLFMLAKIVEDFSIRRVVHRLHQLIMACTTLLFLFIM
ncbi:MAG: 4Fe-4S binding protein, partial [Planctomycetota bacterium]